MSSYFWEEELEDGYDRNSWQGPPHDGNYNTLTPTFNNDLTCRLDWICEHRWHEIRNMVIFRNLVNGHDLQNWWDNGNNQVAFCRGNVGFVAFNNEPTIDLQQNIQVFFNKGKF